MIKSFLLLRAIKPGFKPNNLLAATIALPRSKYPKGENVALFYQQALQKVGAIPGVKAVGAITGLPIEGGGGSTIFTIEGKAHISPERGETVNYQAVSPDYFRVMSIPLLKGRYFTEQDDKRGPAVVIIDEVMARRFWPNEDPVGKGLIADNTRREIVGVVGHVRHGGLTDLKSSVYVPYMQKPIPYMTFVVQAASSPIGLIAGIRSAVSSIDKDQPVHKVRTMEEVISGSIERPRLITFLLCSFAMVAFVLTILGIYGTISYFAAQRTHEIGIRIAIGARQRDILKLVLREAAKLVLIGLVIGLGLAFILSRLLSSLLYSVTTSDPTIFFGVSMVVTLVAMTASYIPASKASGVDPLSSTLAILDL